MPMVVVISVIYISQYIVEIYKSHGMYIKKYWTYYGYKLVRVHDSKIIIIHFCKNFKKLLFCQNV